MLSAGTMDTLDHASAVAAAVGGAGAAARAHVRVHEEQGALGDARRKLFRLLTTSTHYSAKKLCVNESAAVHAVCSSCLCGGACARLRWQLMLRRVTALVWQPHTVSHQRLVGRASSAATEGWSGTRLEELS
jgi:hypothetical protein